MEDDFEKEDEGVEGWGQEGRKVFREGACHTKFGAITRRDGGERGGRNR